MGKVKNLIWDEIELQNDQPPVRAIPTQSGLITAEETPFEKKRRLEADLQKLELARQQNRAFFDARNEAIDDHELRVFDQLSRVDRELEEMGEEV